jgi:hydrogenase/urease accessory protein HupE
MIDSFVLLHVSRFVVSGIHHLVTGYDHVLFITALLLGTRTVSGVLKIISAFTLAHSVTLVLTTLDWISLPSKLVESLIALSIAYVAVESLLAPYSRYRLAVAFVFGLVHGMGFANTLRLSSESGWQLLVELFSFNVGIELGQIFVLLLLFPCVQLVRGLRWGSVAQKTVASLIFIFGLTWFLQRLL